MRRRDRFGTEPRYPPTVVSPAETLYRFFDLDDALRCSFDRKDGVHVEGYALDVEEHRVLFGYGGPLAPEEPEWIDFESIRIAPLHYWSKRESRWVEFIATA